MKKIGLAATLLFVTASAGIAQLPSAPAKAPVAVRNCLVLLPTPGPKPPISVPANARYFGGKWYCPYYEKVTWKNAKSKCERLGGRLAVIHDDPTATFIRILVSGSKFWLGAFETKESQWQWVDGSPIEFENWSKGRREDPNKLNVLVTSEGDGWVEGLPDEKGAIGFICEWSGK